MTHSQHKANVPWKGMFLFGCFFLLNFSSFSYSNTGFAFIGNKKQSIVRFELINNLIVIPITLNNGTKTKAVVDTGVKSVILYGKKHQRKLNFSNTRDVKINGLGKGKMQKGTLAIDNIIQIGGVLGKGVGVISVGSPIPFALLDENGVEAILGYQLFSSFIIEIDYASNEIIFRDPLTFIKDEDAHEFAMEIINTKPYITTTMVIKDKYSQLHAKEMKVLLDTGAALDLLIYSNSKNAKLFLLNAPQKLIIGQGMSGDINGYIARNLSMSIGGAELPSIDVSIADRRSGRQHQKFHDIDGLIGGNILKQYKVTFDYINGAVYLL